LTSVSGQGILSEQSIQEHNNNEQLLLRRKQQQQDFVVGDHNQEIILHQQKDAEKKEVVLEEQEEKKQHQKDDITITVVDVVLLEEKTAVFDKIVQEVRTIKQTGVIMETDSTSLEATGRLKIAARELCKTKYGDYPDDKPYRLAVTIHYQNDQYKRQEQQQVGHFVIEMAPLSLQPYSVYNFLEVARGLQNSSGGAKKKSGFHRKAGHVLQATMSSEYSKKSLAFQEYSKEYPHTQRTVGYCGRPSGGGGCWYISTIDNTKNHGPGSQQKQNPYEADANFGRVISGYDEVVPKIRESMPKPGFLPNQSDWVLITDMTILVPANNNNNNNIDPNDDNSYVEWHE